MSFPIILAHGGAGAPNRDSDGPEAACKHALKFLTDGEIDAALRAVIEAAVILEDDVRFNAGTGANMRIDGSIQMDAILATSDGRIGSVAAIEKCRNPVRVARLVIDSPHVMLCGDGATQFARHRGVPEHDMTTPKAQDRHAKALERLKTGELRPTEQKWRGRGMHGTIGAVARAADGTFAVSCSTGGTSMMLPGRVGDSPIFGAGTMCGEHGAVCATGDGEEIIRRLASMRVYLRIAAGEHPQQACEAEVATIPAPYVAGFIAVSAAGYGMAATKDDMARAALEYRDGKVSIQRPAS
ncbi:MAG: isoaspartyl peptidase/L-asparaginase [Planctomycetes bacterium]|nr:isoaspartyl peptidase/L-asparaginase [Planctomycetota bacterium]